jgi:rubrerythrin
MIQEIKWDKTDIIVEVDACTTHWKTIENLKSAIAWENYENVTMYPEFAEIAREEWLEAMAIKLEAIGQAEVHHEKRFTNLLKALEDW